MLYHMTWCSKQNFWEVGRADILWQMKTLRLKDKSHLPRMAQVETGFIGTWTQVLWFPTHRAFTCHTTMPLSNLNTAKSSVAILTLPTKTWLRVHYADALKSKEKNTVVLKKESMHHFQWKESMYHFQWCSISPKALINNSYMNNPIISIIINTRTSDSRLRQATRKYVWIKIVRMGMYIMQLSERILENKLG